ncbi:hypothetical protein B0H17DRAFT_1145480 [Mycena rosella]|uniref:Uncharacterized protein n=1 Tax=Mycena rosella TaxID=1033263 RepID=A0AAD7CQU2_MYCRO|nr:hypothetical protein B0H17DRAFT_1145480 [Mycena rosella]
MRILPSKFVSKALSAHKFREPDLKPDLLYIRPWPSIVAGTLFLTWTVFNTDESVTRSLRSRSLLHNLTQNVSDWSEPPPRHRKPPVKLLPKSISKDKNPNKEKATGDTLKASEKKENLQASEQKKPNAKNAKKKDKKHDPEYQLEPHKYSTRRSTKPSSQACCKFDLVNVEFDPSAVTRKLLTWCKPGYIFSSYAIFFFLTELSYNSTCRVELGAPKKWRLHMGGSRNEQQRRIFEEGMFHFAERPRWHVTLLLTTTVALLISFPSLSRHYSRLKGINIDISRQGFQHKEGP